MLDHLDHADERRAVGAQASVIGLEKTPASTRRSLVD